MQLELGGKDPTYVCDDVNVKAAAESLADGAMYNNGQSCCSVERNALNMPPMKRSIRQAILSSRSIIFHWPLTKQGPILKKRSVA